MMYRPSRRQDQIEQALALLAGLPLPDLFQSVHEVLCSAVKPDSTITDREEAESAFVEANKKLMRRGMRGAYAATKVEHYLWMWQYVDLLRSDLSKRLYELHQSQITSTAEERSQIAREIYELSGTQEVTIHFFAICGAQLNGLVPVMASSAAMGMTESRKELENRLHDFQDLRDVFEHLEGHLPQGKYAHLLVTESLSPDKLYEIRIGFRFDELGRVVLVDRAVDVSTRALEEIKRLAAKVFEEARLALLSRARVCWESSSDPIPTDLADKLKTYAASPLTHPQGNISP